MKSLAELNAIKAKMQSQINAREGISEGNDIRVAVGMATCGIAAGARPVLNAFVDEIAKRNLQNVKVTQVGCLGRCTLEPMVEITAPNAEKITYAKVTEEAAREIVAQHLVNGNVVSKYLIGG
jgi:NADP-reducing hydrogenase subunit HndB